MVSRGVMIKYHIFHGNNGPQSVGENVMQVYGKKYVDHVPFSQGRNIL